MFKRIITLILIIILSLNLAGCAKCISTEYENVDVVIVDEYYRSAWMQPIHTGKFTSFISHPAQYKITVNYNGVDYTINDSSTYNKYKTQVGQTVTGKLEIKAYDDGAVCYNILSLG